MFQRLKGLYNEKIKTRLAEKLNNTLPSGTLDALKQGKIMLPQTVVHEGLSSYLEANHSFTVNELKMSPGSCYTALSGKASIIKVKNVDIEFDISKAELLPQSRQIEIRVLKALEIESEGFYSKVALGLYEYVIEKLFGRGFLFPEELKGLRKSDNQVLFNLNEVDSITKALESSMIGISLNQVVGINAIQFVDRAVEVSLTCPIGLAKVFGKKSTH